MKITDAKVFVTCPGRNFVTLKIYTDEGLYGIGDATLNGRELAVASYLEDHLIPCLIGRDAFQIEDIWQYFYKGAYWRRGPVTMSAIAAIDLALWDIKGKALNTPVYNLLGGRCRTGVMVYGHANGYDLEETIDEVGKFIDNGYLAIRAQCGVPGIPGAYGVSKDKMFYEPAEKGLPPEQAWSTEKYLAHIPKLFAKLRDTYGDDPHLLHDCHHRLTPIEAGRLGKELEPYHLFWLEDTVPAELQEAFRIIRHHTTTPLAVGEVFNIVYDTTTLITEQLIDYVRMSIVHAGGLSHMKKVANFAEIYNIKMGCHGPTDVSPITMSAAIHFNLSINNFGIQEYMRHTPETDEIFLHEYYFDKGYVNTTDKPGLGVDFDEVLAKKYPYERAYLPVNRKLDGTLFNW
ncbi:MAG: bifunctional D-altronate/D-mannonate dehydratase [Gammaproteobacteria bacterium RIFCSPHIGHO2_12_FULL_41_15]|nr:MAG: bifunctional D-altronate/D-mannonate dehydratase [Gammaproteobacteria bacterium RIFCSPHIGHO2_12_FULL_41_15]